MTSKRRKFGESFKARVALAPEPRALICLDLSASQPATEHEGSPRERRRCVGFQWPLREPCR